MERNLLSEPIECNATSLHGLYTDFDAWIIKYKAFHKRSIGEPQNEENEKQSKQNATDNIIIDIFAANILLKQRHAHKRPVIDLRDHEGFMFFDQILFKLDDDYSNSNVICRLVRSKL